MTPQEPSSAKERIGAHLRAWGLDALLLVALLVQTGLEQAE